MGSCDLDESLSPLPSRVQGVVGFPWMVTPRLVVPVTPVPSFTSLGSTMMSRPPTTSTEPVSWRLTLSVIC